MNLIRLGVALTLAGVATMGRGGETTAPLIHFSWRGGLSNIRSAELLVSADGHVVTKVEACNKPAGAHSFSLNEEEMTSLLRTVRHVRFFEQTENHVAPVDTGESSVTVALGGRTRTLRNILRPETIQLDQDLWKLIHQSVVTSELENNGDVYSAVVAVCPQLVGQKVYSPRQLVDPFMKQIRGCSDKSKLQWGLAGLSWVADGKACAEFLSQELKQAPPERKALMLGVLGSNEFQGSAAKDGIITLLPTLHDELQVYLEQKGKLDAQTDEAVGALCRFMGHQQYRPALPTLSRLAQMHGDSATGQWAKWALETIRDASPQPRDQH